MLSIWRYPHWKYNSTTFHVFLQYIRKVGKSTIHRSWIQLTRLGFHYAWTNISKLGNKCVVKNISFQNLYLDYCILKRPIIYPWRHLPEMVSNIVYTLNNPSQHKTFAGKFITRGIPSSLLSYRSLFKEWVLP